ncbi:uncharacterized protein LOC108907831 isoform X2 [Anoplophora glabripennis]|uniref:uncharacterized protein LOC108907831 isoform X2 n=1 Tax=Anoplophora glabripennis TaxID=217634 RepID=UPI00087396FA|nr:uncharacterized protein LOC108907831 isoform X2 [Anoplophora glabripennis]
MYGIGFKVYQLISLALVGSSFGYGAYGANIDLSGLDNLGEQIQQSVYEGLEPVRALEITTRMKNGVGGTTIATHLPEGKKFIITNNQISQCDGSVSDDGKCSGSLTPFKINEKKDHCYNRQGFSLVNNYICIGASTVSIVNGQISCTNRFGTPALLITLEDYRKLCEGISTSVEYKYIANPQDSKHVEIPNKNKYVTCSNNQPGVCVFTETNAIPNSNANIIINSYNSGAYVSV